MSQSYTLIKTASLSMGPAPSRFKLTFSFRTSRLSRWEPMLPVTPRLTPRSQRYASGCRVLPGMIDSHCHISFDHPNSNDELFFHRRYGLAALVAGVNAQKVLRAGFTSFFDADCVFDVGVDLRDAIEGGVIEGPRMTTGGNVLIIVSAAPPQGCFPTKAHGVMHVSFIPLTTSSKKYINRSKWVSTGSRCTSVACQFAPPRTVVKFYVDPR